MIAINSAINIPDQINTQCQSSASLVGSMAEGNRVFVGNITGRVHKQELKVDFEKFGRVNEVFIGNGFGFVTFDDSRSASRAVDVSPLEIFH